MPPTEPRSSCRPPKRGCRYASSRAGSGNQGNRRGSESARRLAVWAETPESPDFETCALVAHPDVRWLALQPNGADSLSRQHAETRRLAECRSGERRPTTNSTTAPSHQERDRVTRARRSTDRHGATAGIDRSRACKKSAAEGHGYQRDSRNRAHRRSDTHPRTPGATAPAGQASSAQHSAVPSASARPEPV